MRKTCKALKFILILSLVLCQVFVLPSCSSGTAAGQYKVYYTNASRDDLISLDYSPAAGSTEELVEELLNEMYVKDYSTDQYYSVKPDDVSVNDIMIDELNILTIDYSVGYLGMTNVEEIILRSATVLTVIQIDNISGVKFTVNGDPIAYSDGTLIGTMTENDFVNILLNEKGMLKAETDVTIYFTNETGTLLMPVTSHFVNSNNNTSLEEYIVSQIIQGPSADSSVYPTISSNVEVISVVSSDGVCYVNFGQSFLEQDLQPASDEIMIYSIVNSLCRLTYIDSVQFLIDGEAASKLHTLTDISKPFTRNRSLEMVYDY